MESQHWPPDAILAYQRGQLSQLLHHARTQTPFYRERLDPVFKKSGAIDWERWQELPVLTRSNIKENGHSMIAEVLPKGHGPASDAASSGTTGTPITIRTSHLMYIAGTAAFMRAARWYGGTKDDRTCVVLSPNELKSLDRKSWAIGNEGSDRLEGNMAASLLGIDNYTPAESVLSFMEQHGTTCFSGFPIRFDDVAEAQLERRADIRLKYMVGTSMGLTERTRLLGMEAFNARAFSAYTSKEAHKIAHECPVSGGFHVNSELVLVEILDDGGNPCAPGVAGRVVVTPLLSTAQPLIRYEQGDLASWGSPCPCGRSLPVISRIEGRIRNQFHFAGGRRFMPYLGYVPYRDLLKADQWQVAQTGPFDIEVRYISSQPDEAIEFAALTQIFQNAFHKDLRVVYHRVKAMPLTAAGKFIDYVNEYQA
jgi:phenylacetate-CoA ligase